MIRDTLNSGNLNQIGDATQAIKLGSILSYLISKATPTESSVTVTSNVATLAAKPEVLLQCNVATVGSGSATGVKKLRRGPITGAGAVVPAAGECVWDGGTKVLFATTDVAATAHFTYVVATDKASCTIPAINE